MTYWLYNRSMEGTVRYIEQLSKKPLLVEANKLAMKAGYSSCEATKTFQISGTFFSRYVDMLDSYICSIGFGALVGGVAGVAIARLLQKKRPGVANEPTSKPAAAYSLSQPGSPSGTLAERVEQLEREIVALRGEIHELRASVTGASAAESVDGEPAALKLRPANVVPRPYAMPPVVGQKSPPEL